MCVSVCVCVGGWGGVFSPLIVCEIINPDPRRFTVRPTGKRNLIASGDHFFFFVEKKEKKKEKGKKKDSKPTERDAHVCRCKKT